MSRFQKGLLMKSSLKSRCESDSYKAWEKQILNPVNSPESVSKITGVPVERYCRRWTVICDAKKFGNILWTRGD